MIELINNETIIRKPVETGILFKQGEIAQLTVVDGNTIFTRSDGSAPLGPVISADRNTNGATNMAAAQCKRCCYVTDIFETDDVSYSVNALLYVSKNGLLTTKQENPINPAVGMVEVPPSASDSRLKFIWW